MTKTCNNCKFKDTLDCILYWTMDKDRNQTIPNGYPDTWFCADFELKPVYEYQYARYDVASQSWKLFEQFFSENNKNIHKSWIKFEQSKRLVK